MVSIKLNINGVEWAFPTAYPDPVLDPRGDFDDWGREMFAESPALKVVIRG